VNSRYVDLHLFKIVAKFIAQATVLCFCLDVDELAAGTAEVLCDYDGTHSGGGMCVTECTWETCDQALATGIIQWKLAALE
jgi:hypothetical protein